MKQRKFISVLLALAMILGSFGFAFADEDAAAPADAPEITAAPADDPAESGDIVILHTNDVHCTNYENYAKLVELAKSADFVVDAGDAIQGGPIGALSKGEYITEIMNYVKYDVVAPGNHEFDYGMEQFKKVTGEVAEFPYVCCNLVDLKTGKPMLDAYKIFEAKGKKIAFIGVLLLISRMRMASISTVSAKAMKARICTTPFRRQLTQPELKVRTMLSCSAIWALTKSLPLGALLKSLPTPAVSMSLSTGIPITISL